MKMKMKYEAFKPDSYYLRADREVLYVTRLPASSEFVFTMLDAGISWQTADYNWMFLCDWLGECDRDGNLLTTEPAPGQVWKSDTGVEYLLNAINRPEGSKRYAAVGNAGCWNGYNSMSPAEAVEGLTLRTLEETQ
jgi:hypothetical protein